MKIVIAWLLAVVLLATAFNIPSREVYAVEVLSLEEKIDKLALEYHVNPLVAHAIISCESNYKEEARGTMAVVGTDIGTWQINSYFHKESANKRGLNIYNSDENLRYGMILLFENGTAPWKSSKPCWSKKLLVA
ncbi:MAG TPA: hypothetical protein VJH92_02870 [Candidatus Nanoarchaeia archaeon]|nr:hypothetical protein [Candidatus Nanoarchaeia archaeon]